MNIVFIMLRINNMTKDKGCSSTRTYTTLDAYVAGFLTLRKHIPDFIDQNGKFVFVFIQSDELSQDLDDYNAGAVVEAAKFAFAIKTLKGQIHSLRKEKDNLWRKDLLHRP